MNQSEIIDKIYNAIIQEVKSQNKKEDYQIEICKQLFDDYDYFIKVAIDIYWGWYLVIDINIGKIDETPLKCDLKTISLEIENKLEFYFNNL